MECYPMKPHIDHAPASPAFAGALPVLFKVVLEQSVRRGQPKVETASIAQKVKLGVRNRREAAPGCQGPRDRRAFSRLPTSSKMPGPFLASSSQFRSSSFG